MEALTNPLLDYRRRRLTKHSQERLWRGFEERLRRGYFPCGHKLNNNTLGSEHNLYKIGATGASSFVFNNFGVMRIYEEPFMWVMNNLWTLPTMHASKDAAYHACFRGRCLPCMFRRMLLTMHASEDAAYPACFGGCCLSCMLQRMLLTRHASKDSPSRHYFLI
ncbi:hypothetical protein Tco_1353128 [Tanacetum coccineum]